MRKDILNQDLAPFTSKYLEKGGEPDYLDCVDEAAQDVLAVLDGVNYHTARAILEKAMGLLNNACFVDKTSGAFARP